MQHSELAPSSMHRIVQCAAFVSLAKNYPETKTEQSIEGDAAHEYAASYLTDNYAAGAIDIGATTSNGTIITEEMADYTTEYIDDVMNITGMDESVAIETPVPIPRVHALCFGTPDSWFFDWSTMTLYIWDLKYGYGVVEVYRNWQLMCYAVGIIDIITGKQPECEQRIKVVLTIAQPRAYHTEGTLRRWEIYAVDLRNYANQMNSACCAALMPDTSCTTGKACRNCEAMTGCPANHQASMYAVDVAEIPGLLENADLGLQLRILRYAADLINNRVTAIEELALVSGQPISGYGVGFGRGSTKWKKSPEEIFMMGDLMEKDLRKPAAPCTPNQANKKGIPWDVLDQYTQKFTGKKKLVEFDANKTMEIFKK